VSEGPFRTSASPGPKKPDWWERNGFRLMALVMLFGMGSGAVRSTIQWTHDELVCPSPPEHLAPPACPPPPEPTSLTQECDSICEGFGLRHVAHDHEVRNGHHGIRCICIEHRRSCAWHSDDGALHCWDAPSERRPLPSEE
jgi:hypothetical protein